MYNKHNELQTSKTKEFPVVHTKMEIYVFHAHFGFGHSAANSAACSLCQAIYRQEAAHKNKASS